MILSLFSGFFVFKQKTAYEMRISDWSSDVCSSDLLWQHRTAGSVPGGPARTPGGIPDAGQRAQRRRAMAARIRGLPKPGARAAPEHAAGYPGIRAVAEIGRASGRERACQYV